MVVHFIKRSRQIKSTETDSGATRNIYSYKTVLMEYIALEQLSSFLKPNWLSLAVKGRGIDTKVGSSSSKLCWSEDFGK